jgi:hypothetical protein
MVDKKLAIISLEDLGNLTVKIFSNSSYIRKDVYFSGDLLTVQEIANEISNVVEIKCEYDKLSNESYRNLGFLGAAELGNMF